MQVPTVAHEREIGGLEPPTNHCVDSKSSVRQPDKSDTARNAVLLGDLYADCRQIAETHLNLDKQTLDDVDTFYQRINYLEKNDWKAGQVSDEVRKLLQAHLEAHQRFPKAALNAYKEQSRRRAKEVETIRRKHAKYFSLENQLSILSDQQDMAYANLFSSNTTAIYSHQLGELSRNKEKVEAQMAKIRENNPQLVAYLEYRKVMEYERQLRETGYVITPSRERLTNEIRKAIIQSSHEQPPLFLLTGPSGSGKTTISQQISRLLLDREAESVVCSRRTNPVKYFGSRVAKDGGGFFVQYGVLGRFITGTVDSLDSVLDDDTQRRIAIIDEITLMEEEDITMLVKNCAAIRRGQELRIPDLPGANLIAQGHGAIIMTTNVYTEDKHAVRSDIPNEALREFSDKWRIPYLEQTAENPEIFHILVSSLMDPLGQLLVSPNDIAIPWKEVDDPRQAKKKLVIDMDNLKRGGVIWRLANFISQAFLAYEGNKNTLTASLGANASLSKAVPDLNKFIRMFDTYKRNMHSPRASLHIIISDFLDRWIGNVEDAANQESFPENDRKFLESLRATCGLDRTTLSHQPNPFKLSSSLEIGKMLLLQKPEGTSLIRIPETDMVFGDEDNPHRYQPQNIGVVPEGVGVYIKIGDNEPDLFTAKGITQKDRKYFAVLQGDSRFILLEADKFEFDYAKQHNFKYSELFGRKPAARFYGDVYGENDGFLYHDGLTNERLVVRFEPIVIRAGRRISRPGRRISRDYLINETEYFGQIWE